MAKTNKSKKAVKSSKSAKNVKKTIAKVAKKPVVKKKANVKSNKAVVVKKIKTSAKKIVKAGKLAKKLVKELKKLPKKNAIKKLVVKKVVVKNLIKKTIPQKISKPKVEPKKIEKKASAKSTKPEIKGKFPVSSVNKKEKNILKSDKKIVKTEVKELLPKPEKTILSTPSKPAKSRGRKKKKKGDDDDEFDGSEPLDPALLEILNTVHPQKKKGGPKIIQTFVNPINSLPTEFDTDAKIGKNKKEPKGKFELEYVVRTSPGILYECLSTPSGLSEWFADDVNIRDGVFTFFWDGSEQKAKLLGYKDEKFIRFQWLDKTEGSYFEFKIEKDELTGDISLIITDFAEEVTDKTTSQLLWDSQVNKLLHVLGAV